LVVDMLKGKVVQYKVVPDSVEAISETLIEWTDEHKLDLILTNGGTGLSPTDVTPEATRDVIDREAPGYAETIRAESRRHTPLGILTRGTSGIRGRTLIVNFPGNPKAIDQSWPVV
jgi:molybdopterin adenylyltransferase